MIRLRTLGSLDLQDAEGRALRTVVAQPKRVALLAWLALATPRGPHRRDSVLALFWPEQDAEHGRNALTQAVYFLRHSLGADAIVTGNGDEVGLRRGDFWCDAIAFEEALDQGRLAEALELYQGELLDGLHVSEAPEFARWLEEERARLAARHRRAMECAAEERERAGDFGGAVAWWRRLAAEDLYSSRIALRLMRALSAAGEPGAAIRHARIHEALLREELGVAPDGEVAAFVRQLQAVKVEEPRAPLTAYSPPAREEPPGTPERLRESTDARADDGAAASPPSPAAPHPEPRVRRRVVTMTSAVLLALVGGVVAVVMGSGMRPPAASSIRSLAVLPLEALSGDSADARFADGMHDVLITELARYPELSVISRTSVLHYRATKLTLPEIARELGVDGVIEGTLLRDGGRVRMTVQLVHGRTDRHLWAGRYERNVGDVLALQADLAREIAREVSVAAAPVARLAHGVAGPPDSVPAELYLRELYLKGRHAELSRSLAGIETARDAYRLAIERDSSFALGYAGLAAVYGFMADYDYAPVRPALDTARAMARRAVALDSTLPETRTALAVTLGDAGRFADAEREFKRAIELGPSSARAHYWYSVLLVALGRGEEALREANRAAALDPFGPRGIVSMQRYAIYLNTGERPHLKLPITERRPILKLEPGEPWAHAREAIELAQAGRCDEARPELRRARQLAPGDNFRMLPFVGSVDWWCGERPRARALLREMKRRPDAYDHGFRMAWLHTVFGEKDSAFVWLPRHRWTMAELTALRGDAVLDSLRTDPRYVELLLSLGVRTPGQKR